MLAQDRPSHQSLITNHQSHSPSPLCVFAASREIFIRVHSRTLAVCFAFLGLCSTLEAIIFQRFAPGRRPHRPRKRGSAPRVATSIRVNLRSSAVRLFYSLRSFAAIKVFTPSTRPMLAQGRRFTLCVSSPYLRKSVFICG